MNVFSPVALEGTGDLSDPALWLHRLRAIQTRPLRLFHCWYMQRRDALMFCVINATQTSFLCFVNRLDKNELNSAHLTVLIQS